MRVKRTGVTHDLVDADAAPQHAQRRRGPNSRGMHLSRHRPAIREQSRGLRAPAGASQFAPAGGTNPTDSARIDFDQRPICGIAQHSTYGEKAAAGSPRPTPRRISQGAASGVGGRCAVEATRTSRRAR
jgi:hypothetical protein